MRVKLLLFSFYLNGGLIAHSFYRKTVWTDVKLWTVCFLKTESEPYFGFPHISISAIYKEAWLMIVAIYRTVLISHSILSAVCCPVLLAGLWELWNILSVMINCPASETEVKWWDRELKMALLLSVALGFLFLHQARTTGQGIVSSGRPFVCYQTWRDILKTNAPVLVHIGISDPWSNSMKQWTLRLGGQRSR